MSDELEVIEHAGLTIKVYFDDSPYDPHKEYDGLGVFVLSSNSYDLANDLDIDFEDHDGPDALRAFLVAEHDAKLILPVWGYSHSGLALKAGDRTYPFDCPWDSGFAGFIFMNSKGMEEATDPEAYLKGELDEYNAYLSGQVFGYTIEDEDGDVVESCWGFYDQDYMLTSEAKPQAEYIAQEHVTRTETALAAGSLPMSAEGLVMV